MTIRVGILREAERGGVVETTGKNRIPPISIPPNALNGAPFGMSVVVELTTEEDATDPRGRIVEVLGDPMRPDVAIQAIIRDHGLRTDFPRGVLQAAALVPTTLSDEVIDAELARGRKDLRSLRTITIDGKDAKDLDDAISIRELPGGGYTLWVHIADVTHYVKEGSSMDKEALLRGNSVYLVDRVLPMLPPRLSNGICSLNPNVDRLALTCMMQISPDGHTVTSEIFESLIRSDHRTNYIDVFAALETADAIEEYRDIHAELLMMQRCASLLAQHRSLQGNLEFAFPETKVDLDSEGRPTDIYAYPINEANGIIEEFMIAANQAVAKTFTAKRAPFLYRVHELPDPEKLDRFVRTAKLMNVHVKFKGAVPDTRELARILDQVKATPYEAVLSQLLLQSLAKARYSEQPLGHYGLGIHDYSHFTSPIRRYPDLFIHRVIKGYLNDSRRERKWRKAAPDVALHCSETEREAMYAEYDTVDQKVAEYMSERLGEHYTARISGMIDAGIFVMLENTIEGMIPFRTMNDYFVFDPDTLTAQGSRSGRRFKIGQELEVVIARADLIRRQVDFMLPDDWTYHQKKRNNTRSHAQQNIEGRGKQDRSGRGKQDGSRRGKPDGSKRAKKGQASQVWQKSKHKTKKRKGKKGRG